MNWMQRALILVAALTPTYLLRFKIGGIPTTVFEILIIAMCVATIVRAIVYADVRGEYAQKIRAIPATLIFGAAAFFIAGCISVVVAPNVHAAFGIWRAYIVESMAFGLVAWLYLKTFKEFRVLAIAFSITAAVVAIYAIVQKFTGWGIPNPFWRAEATRRVTSFFGYPNAVGLYLELVIPFFVASIILVRERISRAWFAFVILISCLAILFAESSGTLAALAGTAGLFLLVWKRTRLWVLGIGLVCVLALIFSPLRKPFADEFLLQGFSGRLRTQMWKETVVMLKPRWVQGAGLAGYQERVKPFHVFQWAEIYLYPHNLVLTLWSELGVLGLAAFAWIVCLVLVWMARAVQHGSLESRVWSGAIIAVLMIIVIHGLVDIPYFKNDFSSLFWLLIAMAAQIRYTFHSIE